MSVIIAPSLLSADFLNLSGEINMLNASDADWIHLDVMDGLFVPNISFGFPVIEKVARIATKPLDVHLMIVDPDRYIQRFVQAGASLISVHYEACTHLNRTIHSIKNLGVKAGVVLNPHTPVSVLSEIITDVDFVLLMAVNPGFGGQKFISGIYRKIRQLRDLINESGKPVMIEIDGGVDLTNAAELITAGADILVAGNSIFSAQNPQDMIRQLKLVR
jgi:ribulose-phosphate 3-epimerase